MQKADNKFFEEYKHLDKLCGDMFSCRNGVSEYISRMEEKAALGQRLVPGWNACYKGLKHVRWVRNQIAHDSGSSQFSEPEDLGFVCEYYDLIMKGKDALALLKKASLSNPRRKTGRPAAKRSVKKRRGHKVISVIAALLLIVAALYYFKLH